MKNKNKTTVKKNISVWEDILFYLIIIPLVFVIISLINQKLINPNKIPDIFGYKIFFILNDDMDKSIKYGDLVITHTIEPKYLKQNDLIAFKNNTDIVTIHRIIKITVDNIGRQFEIQNYTNEVENTRYVRDEQVEGVFICKIPNIGLVLFKIQESYVILILTVIVMMIGLIAYYVAGRLDKRDMEK